MIAQLYTDLKQPDKALEAYYTAKFNISKKSTSYINALYNIGLLESLKRNYDKAEPAFIELLGLAPDDYQSAGKLVQVYYGLKQYDKARPWKDKLYAAHKKDLLKGNLKKMFCFDQFDWNGKVIQGYEYFEECKQEGDIKLSFFVVTPDNDIDFKICTEYSPISKELGGAAYLLCKSQGNTHATYNAGFNEDYKYEDLKKSVIDILDGKIKPGASTVTH